MRKIFAIAVISIRNAIRSRVVASLLAMLALLIIGLPLTVKTDGTIGGHVQVLLTYTMGGVIILLSITTLWAACAAMSQDIGDHRIHLVVAKPVSRTQVWIGKWLGLMAMNALLLGISGAAVYGLLRWTTAHADLSETERTELENEILVARHLTPPILIDVEDQAQAMLDERVAAGPLPAGISPQDALKAIRQSLLIRAYSAAQGGRVSWTFQVPPGSAMERPIQVRFKFSSSSLGPELVPGTWLAGPEGHAPVFEYTETTAPGGFHTFAVPPEAAAEGGRIVLTYVNRNAFPITVLFSPEDGLVLLTYAGTFEMNFLRTLLILYAHLAFLAALGVSAGSMFSMPVAALASVYTMVLLKTAPYIETMASRTVYYGDPSVAHAPAFYDLLTGAFFRVMELIVVPLRTPNPLDLVGVGLTVPWSWVGAALAIKVLVYGSVLAGAGTWILHRRELGLPS